MGRENDTALVNLVRVKRHHKTPIKIYWSEETQLAQRLFLFITIIILMKQKLYYQYVSAKQNKKTTLT